MKREIVATGEAARRLGVAPATIQRWVDSGLLHAERTPGGHRRIHLAEVRRLISSTLSPEIAKPLSLWLDILLAGDFHQLKSMLLTSRQRCGSWAQVADELASAVVELGRRWEAGNCLVFEEHIASETLRRATASCASDITRDDRAPRAVLCSLEGERHILGLSLAELVLAEAGWRVLLIGEGPPMEEIPSLLQKLKPKLLIVSASAILTRQRAVSNGDALQAAATAARAKLVLAGGAPWVARRNVFLVTSFEELRVVIERVSKQGARFHAL
ncbi:excisionase family DNA-binding protein [Nordella sp. HKS 07]|uniref:MerR family transcriptional regulator n=1 Tax=Nordella sp. HKS 07 TaxID=2712222 RepID=UPI0013E1036A|nr:MerR family DNA-binding transcriptional regulator [Nordella sp. HKS 07]QIG46797.1 excisionase family DNA-binding protein [Nordella sp. HKS 07]